MYLAARRTRWACSTAIAPKASRSEQRRVAIGADSKGDGSLLCEHEERRGFGRHLQRLTGDRAAEIGRVEEELIGGLGECRERSDLEARFAERRTPEEQHLVSERCDASPPLALEARQADGLRLAPV